MRATLLRRLIRVGIVMAVGAVMLGTAVGVSAAPRGHGQQGDDEQNASDQAGNRGGDWLNWVWGNGNADNVRPGWGRGDRNHEHSGPPGNDEDHGNRPGARIPRVSPFSTRASTAPATHFEVLAPQNVVNGSAFSLRVIALDGSNNRTTAYSGTVHFTSSDGSAALPGDTTLTNGRGAFSATLKTNGNQTITAADTVTNSITGTSGNISVSPAGLHFVISSAPSSTTAGNSFNITVTAQDQNNNTITNFGDTIHFTSSDGSASLPADTTLSNGTGTFSVQLRAAGNQTITVTDTANDAVTGTSNTIAVSPSGVTHFGVSAPSDVNTNNSFNFTVTALDQFGNTVTSYGDQVQFSSTDVSASLPVNSGLSNGTNTFSITLKSTGNQTITATDPANTSVMGTSGIIRVH